MSQIEHSAVEIARLVKNYSKRELAIQIIELGIKLKQVIASSNRQYELLAQARTEIAQLRANNPRRKLMEECKRLASERGVQTRLTEDGGIEAFDTETRTWHLIMEG